LRLIQQLACPTPILNEVDSLAFDTLAVASPAPGSDVTLVIQT